MRGADLSTYKIDVPAKLFIAGEYAVTRLGGLALVTSLESDFQVVISEVEGHSLLETNVAMPAHAFSVKEIKPEHSGPWNFVMTAIKYMSKEVELTREFHLEIKSGLGFGENKKGYGSSACVVVGVVNAVNLFFQLNLPLKKRFEIAAQAHYDVQGSGSRGDVAAIMYGGSIFYENHQRVLPLKIPWQTYVVQTAQSAKTVEKLEHQLSEAFYAKSDELVIEISTAIDMHDFALFKEKLLENQLLLIEHQAKGYMTDQLALALNIVNSQPEFAGKISGAGFGENIILFAEREDKIVELRSTLEAEGMKLEKIRIGKQNE